MSRLAFIADCHLGNPNRFGGPVVAGINARGRMVLDVFREACRRARELECDRLVVAGDLADTSRWRPQWVRAAQEALACAPDLVDILVGNHDQESAAEGDHALGPLTEVNLVAVHEQPTVIAGGDAYEIWAVPFQTGPAEQWLPGVLDKLGPQAFTDRPAILVLHLGIRDAHTAPWLAESPDAIDVDLLATLMRKHNIRFTIAGNWHDRRVWSPPHGMRIVQCGALCPTGWSNPGLEGYGHLTILDTQTGEIVSEELPGPRFLKVRWGDEGDFESQVRGATARGHTVFLELSATPADLEFARGWLEYALAMGWLYDGEAVPDDSAAREQAQQAGIVARSAESRDEAISGFVSTMPLPPDVPRHAVLEEVRGYIGKSR